MSFKSITKRVFFLTPLLFSLVWGCKSTEEKPVETTSEAAEEEAIKVENLTLSVNEIHFDYDKSEVKAEFREELAKVAAFLEKMPNVSLDLEGHCDQRGTTQYNLALGQRRADSVKNYLITLGVSENRLRANTFGEEKLVCTEETEECYAKNRRVSLKVVA